MIFRTAELFAGPGGGAYAAKQSHFVDKNGVEWGFTHAWLMNMILTLLKPIS